jgi:phosphate transport system permease protein
MSSEPALRTIVASLPSSAPPRRSFGQRRAKSASSLSAQGEPMVWLTGGCLAVSLAMICGLLCLVVSQGLSTFWPVPVVRIDTHEGHSYLGEITRHDEFRPQPSAAILPARQDAQVRAEISPAAPVHRELLRTGNFELSGTHFHWIDDEQITLEMEPEWALVVERLNWGRFYGTPEAFLIDGQVKADKPAEIWAQYSEFHGPARERWGERVKLEHYVAGEINRRRTEAELNLKQAELAHGAGSAQYEARQRELAKFEVWQAAEAARVTGQIQQLNADNARYQLKLRTASGQEKSLSLDEIVRAYPANQLSISGKLGLFFDRWREFLCDEPRAANSEGGVFPAIFGTVVMTLVMTLAVVPFGVLAALYLREYAKPGPIVSVVRIAINNLAGVPSIVFGVFGLGFFCYVVGADVDQLFFSTALAVNRPTFGTGGLLWASLTLALLTLPVVIVTTEEALAAVPSSMREGSYACGASKWQTIQRIVLPRALPGIMTGMILAMARGAGEVAPLMLVGAVKSAPELPVDGVFPFVHAQRSFMHLGFHIYDLGFQSQNSEAAKPMVFTTTLLLIGIITFLNVTAIWLRGRLRRRFVTSHF